MPDDLVSYSKVGLQIDHGLAGAVKRFWGAMNALRPAAAAADSRIPRMLDGSMVSEESDVVRWLAHAEEVDSWVGTVARAFVDAEGNTPLLGPKIRVTVAADDLSRALTARESAPPDDELDVSGGKLRGPNGEMFPVVIPPMTDGHLFDPVSCVPDPNTLYNADHYITPDDPTSMAQTREGSDPGWVVIRETHGLTAINKPSTANYVEGAISPPLDEFGEPAGPKEYRDFLEQFGGRSGDAPVIPPSGGLPADNPFLKSRDGYAPPPGIPMPDMGRQETVDAAVGGVTQIDESLSNIVHLKNGALAAYHTTYEHNVDGRTRAIVRLYKIGKPPGSDDTHISAYYGAVDGKQHWSLTPIKIKPPAPGSAPSMGPA